MTMNHEYFISYSVTNGLTSVPGRITLTLEAPIDADNIGEMLDEMEEYIGDEIGSDPDYIVLTNWKYLGSTINKNDIQ